MKAFKIATIAFTLICALMITACSSAKTPIVCSSDIGTTENAATFDQYFNNMTLVSKATGLSGTSGNNGPQFADQEILNLKIDSKTGVDLRACVQPLTGANILIPFDQTLTIKQGQGVFDIGTYVIGTYIVRVVVGNTLVKNFPFEIK